MAMTVRGPSLGRSQNHLLCLQSRATGAARLELPIDHFRFLGVNPAADAQTVLRTLQLRIDRPPDQGFTQETLQARAELLRASADLLSDSERRSSYEAELTALESPSSAMAAGLDIGPSMEVAGLLLLLEAGQGAETFEVARRSLNPPQAPALGSSREADLILVAALACQASAEDYRKERRYEASAQTLQLGLQLLQRTGQLPASRQTIERTLAALLPYRILDLLSRDLAAVSERNEGLQLLEQLVQQRGGLDGPGDGHFEAEEFQAFFKQIRQFLTVQEQVDLFSHWAVQSSPTATFLASYALTASGFSQRKPERVAAARERLSGSGQPGVEAYEACLSLLLGQIDTAKAQFARGASEELRQWAAEQGEDPLAGLCAYCQDWLDREVLPGYRDIETGTDLEAWFADRDVQLYVDRQDRVLARGGEGGAALAGSGPWGAPNAAASTGAGGGGSLETAGFSGNWPSASEAFFSGTNPLTELDGPELEHQDGFDDDGMGWPTWEWPQWHWPPAALAGWRLPSLPRPKLGLPPQVTAALGEIRPDPQEWPLSRWGKPTALALLALGITAGGVLALRSRVAPTGPRITTPLPAAPTPPVTQPKPQPAATGAMQSAEPSEAELQALLERWLGAKSSVLAGSDTTEPLDELARPALVEQLKRQRREEAARGETQRIEAKVRHLTITSRSPERMEAEVELSYSDELRNREGRLLESTPVGSRSNRYVFGRYGTTWKLVAFRPLA